MLAGCYLSGHAVSAGIVQTQLAGVHNIAVTTYVSADLPFEKADSFASHLTAHVEKLQTEGFGAGSTDAGILSLTIQSVGDDGANTGRSMLIRVEFSEEVLLKRSTGPREPVWATTWSQQVIRRQQRRTICYDLSAQVRLLVDDFVTDVHTANTFAKR